MWEGGTFKEGLARLLENTHVQCVFMGTRRNDPHGGGLEHLDLTTGALFFFPSSFLSSFLLLPLPLPLSLSLSLVLLARCIVHFGNKQPSRGMFSLALHVVASTPTIISFSLRLRVVACAAAIARSRVCGTVQWANPPDRLTAVGLVLIPSRVVCECA